MTLVTIRITDGPDGPMLHFANHLFDEKLGRGHPSPGTLQRLRERLRDMVVAEGKTPWFTETRAIYNGSDLSDLES